MLECNSINVHLNTVPHTARTANSALVKTENAWPYTDLNWSILGDFGHF